MKLNVFSHIHLVTSNMCFQSGIWEALIFMQNIEIIKAEKNCNFIWKRESIVTNHLRKICERSRFVQFVPENYSIWLCSMHELKSN